MEYIYEFFQSNNILALAVSATIFLITVILVAKRFIGFMITLLLLGFSIAAGYAVLNNDLVREYLKGRWEHPQPGKAPTKEEDKPPSTQLKEQIMRAFEEIKRQLTQEKESLQTMSEDLQTLFAELEEQKQKLRMAIQEKRESLHPSDPQNSSDPEENASFFQ